MTENSERYWEARWRDEKAENERLCTSNAELLAVLATIAKPNSPCSPETMAIREMARAAIAKAEGK